MVLGQLGERGADGVELLPHDGDLVGARVAVDPADDGIQLRVVVARAHVVDDGIPGQPEEPAPEGNATRLVPRQRFQGLDEDMLRQVLHVRRALDAAGDEAIHPVVVMVKDHPECPRIPVAGLGHESFDRSVVDGHNDRMPTLVRCASRSRRRFEIGPGWPQVPAWRHDGRRAR